MRSLCALIGTKGGGAVCSFSMTDFLLIMESCERASKEELEKIFTKYATVEKDGEFFMTHDDFVCHYLRLAEVGCAPQTKLALARVADTTRNGLISLSEFRAFESLLTSPDSVSQLAFKLFDIDNRGSVSFANFHLVLSLTSVHQAAPFDFNCPLVKQYFGSKRDRSLDYHDFTQLLQSLPTEHARQVFSAADSAGSGNIPALEFVDLMMRIRKYRMSPYIQDNLLTVAGGGHTRNVSYPYFKGFNQFLGNLDILQRVVTTATRNGGSATHNELLREARCYGQVTPLQVALLFQLCDLEHRRGAITSNDFKKLLPRPSFAVYPPVSKETTTADSGGATEEVPLWLRSMEPLYRFSLGSIAGATGATAVYPIDLVKTRMQNQRGSLPGEIMYKNSLDCFAKVVRNEGVFGLYRGLVPQLVGVSPEKAIKLTMNDTMRDVLRGKDGSLPLWKECVAGGCGGASQVIFTNPIEIVKIRLQVAGEMTETAKLGATRVIKDLGFLGLYKGALACFLRDIPFSAIYFPAYAHMKKALANEQGHIGPAQLFTAGFVAGVPAAGLLTPADVIKTRLQVMARKGQATYNGIADCAVKVMKMEGPRAFWKGTLARILRSSPQFGVTLLTYELLQRLFYVDFGKGGTAQPVFESSGSIPAHLSDHIGGYRTAHWTFASVESRYGLLFPRSRPETQ